jgi:hypothetical protein
MIPQFEAGIVLPPGDRGFSGPEAPPGNSLSNGTTPSIDLEAAYSIAREVGRESMTEFELQDLRFKARELSLKSRLGITKEPCRDCRTAYAGIGLLGIPFLLKDTITNSGCTWNSLEIREREIDLGRDKEIEKREYISNLINNLITDPP